MGTSSAAHGRRCWFNRLVLGKIHITTYLEGQVRQLWDQAFARGAGAKTRP
jgi:hypothetical protein